MARNDTGPFTFVPELLLSQMENLKGQQRVRPAPNPHAHGFECVCVRLILQNGGDSIMVPAVALIPTWSGCRCARPSDVASRWRWKQISHRLRNCAKHTAGGKCGEPEREKRGHGMK